MKINKLKPLKEKSVTMLNGKSIFRFRTFMFAVAILVLTISSFTFASASYARTSTYTQTTFQAHAGNVDFPFLFNREMCQAGQDFILQVNPLGCTPSVIRSDLLEEQNVPVFCPIVGTKLNPLIDVEAINNIRFSFNGAPPKEVQGLSYVPARAALVAPKLQLDQPVLNGLGYAVIVLKRQPNESAMPDFVQGNLTATLKYDIKNAFGVGQAEYYLTETDCSEESLIKNSFWRGKGYLCAESIDDDGVDISIYSDREAYGLGKTGEKRKITSHNIGVGKSSPPIPMPGFNYCLGTMEVKLNGLENPGTRAKLTVNNDIFELKEGAKFLDENKCSVKKIEKSGIVQRVEISCRQDEPSKPFTLTINPRIELIVDGKTGTYNIGDQLYPSDANGEKFVYIGYIGTTDQGKLFFIPVVSPAKTSEEFKETHVYKSLPGAVKRISWKSGNVQLDALKNFGNSVGTGLKTFTEWVGTGASPVGFVYEDGTFIPWPLMKNDDYTNKFRIKGFADAVDAEFPKTVEGTDLKNNYEKAVKDYETIREDFSSDLYPQNPQTEGDKRTLGEKALFNYIELAWKANKKETASKLCKEFSETYLDSTIGAPTICDNALMLSSQESSVEDVLINGRTYLVTLDSIKEPSLEDYSVDVLISGTSGKKFDDRTTLGINDRIYVSEKEFFELKNLERDYAEFDVRGIEGTGLTGNLIKVNLNSHEIVGKNKYTIRVNQINLKKLAKVSVIPSIHLTETRANFQFKIGIEKRGIKLSPEKTKEKIESLNKTLEKWRGINARLGTVVKTGKAACLATGTALTIKNFFANLDGKGIARQKIMRGSEGWFEICENALNKNVNKKIPAPDGKTYDNVDSCLLGNSAAIESSVNTISEEMETQKGQMEVLQKLHKDSDGFLGEDVINTEKLMADYVDEGYRQELTQNIKGKFNDNNKLDSIKVGNEEVDVSEAIKSVTPANVFLTQARNLQLNSRLLNSQDKTVKQIALAEVKADLTDIYVNSKKETMAKIAAEKYKFSDPIVGSSNKKLQEISIEQKNIKKWSEVESGFSGAPVGSIAPDATVVNYIDESDGKEYVLVLDEKFIIRQTYLIIAGAQVNSITRVGTQQDPNHPNPLGLSIKKYDASTYENKFENPLVKYFERDPYRGLPAVVPFDLQKGWYAAVKSTVAVGGSIKAYDDSGRVSSFWLCNIGANKREEFNSGTGDDICQMINIGTGQPYNQFPGLEKDKDASKLVTAAVNAIQQASQARARDAKVSQVIITSPSGIRQTIKVGEPAVEIPGIQCQDFMSPADCNLLFNVCDPVICPSSRCDLGGTYPVQDVVQSGVVGGLLLCAPNFPEVKVPICLSGIHAGLEGYLSVLDSYQQCLQTSLETGQTVGVCDEIHSVYMCEFFWRQGLPLANIIVPKVVGSVLGQNVRGGGEYLGVQDAWQRAGDSVDFFTQYYADDSYKAFKARNAENVGTEICKNWVSFTAPGGGNLLDSLTTPDVPAQFLGRFDEIPFTSVTNPPISQYKVFYHIFAGKDFPAYYQVYLRGEAGTFFRDTELRRVVPGGTGVIPVGKYESKTVDFTAPSGYKEICIVVNNQEECGFKQVTTEFGVNYITEKFVADQAAEKDITSETACISGTPSLLGFATTLGTSGNIQSAIGSNAPLVGNQELYNRGITRICATDNPGLGTDSKIGTEDQRWQAVGYCGNTNIKCWLDKDNVRNIIKSTTTEADVLNEVTPKIVDALGQEGGPINEEQFEVILNEIKGAQGDNAEKISIKKIEIINQNMNKILFNHQKGYLTLLRADAYSGIAREIIGKLKAKETFCGDGATQSPNGKGQVEKCDDGNTNSGDGCSGSCMVEQPGEQTGETKTAPTEEEPEPTTPSGTTPALKCEDCGKGAFNYCREDECNDIARSLGKQCIFEDGFFTNSCTATTIPSVKSLCENCVDNPPGLSFKQGIGTSLDVTLAEKLIAVKNDPSTQSINWQITEAFPPEVSHADECHSKGTCVDLNIIPGFGSGSTPTQDTVNRINAMLTALKNQGLIVIFETTNDADIAKLKTAGVQADSLRTYSTTTAPSFHVELSVSSTTPPSTLTCSTNTECQQVLGREIIKIAQSLETSDARFSDETVKEDTGAKNFECLVLMLAMGESGGSQIQHCNPIKSSDGNPLYCNGDSSKVVGGDSDKGGSYGAMQINSIAHESAFPEVYDFETNVEYGINLLVGGYASEEKSYRCYRQVLGSTVRASDFVSKSYSGWQRALRNYNGWNSQCYTTASDGKLTSVGNPIYVDYVLSKKNSIESLFPECKV